MTKIVILSFVLLLFAACNNGASEVTGFVTQVNHAELSLLVGESNETKWVNYKPSVYLIKVSQEDINNYPVGSKITFSSEGPAPAKLPAKVIPKTINLEQKIPRENSIALENELKKITTPPGAPGFFIKDITQNIEDNTWNVEIYNYVGERLQIISIPKVQ
jgi:hypothetical protein